MTERTVDTYKHEQTDKIHIVKEAFPGTVWICYCSFNRRYEPTERDIDLEDEEVCNTCANGYLDDTRTEAERDAEPIAAD